MNAKSMNKLVSQIGIIKAQLIKQIQELPNATPGVKMLSKNCAIVSSKTVMENGGILSASYYINHENKKRLIERIERGSIESLGKMIDGIIERGSINHESGQCTKVSPAFIKALKEMWNG